MVQTFLGEASLKEDMENGSISNITKHGNENEFKTSRDEPECYPDDSFLRYRVSKERTNISFAGMSLD